MKNFIGDSIALTFTIILFSLSLKAQTPDTLRSTYVLKVDELMKLERKSSYDKEIVSASKKAESLFEAPVSASVLTREEIKASGATSIVESLRLVPGVIVRKMLNGNYNVHIRGMDWLPHQGEEELLVGLGKLALVMIDGRPVYNYLLGSTMWQTLPVDLNDVERIEVIRGPAASLYGPNAVSGVINIITTRPQSDGAYAIVNAQTGSFNSNLFNASLGYRFSDKFSVVASGNRQYMDRTTDLFYSKADKDYVPLEEISFFGGLISGNQTEQLLYPNRNLGLEKTAFNFLLEHKPNDKISYIVRGGMEDSGAKGTLFPDYASVLNEAYSNTKYIETQGDIHNLRFKTSYLSGDQDVAYGLYHAQKMRFIDSDLSYNLQIGKLSILPSISYRNATYEHPINQELITSNADEMFDRILYNIDPSLPFDQALELAIGTSFHPPYAIMDGETAIENLGGSIKFDYRTMADKLRFVASVRGDQFLNLSDDIHLSYQFSTTFLINKNHLLRAELAKSFASQFIINTQLVFMEPKMADIGLPYELPGIRETKGDKNVTPTNQRMVEFGYRGKLNKNFSIDVEAFIGELHDQISTIKDTLEIDIATQPIPKIVFHQHFRNLPAVAKQTGVTVSLNYTSKNFWIRPFVTYQNTIIENFSDYFATEKLLDQFPKYSGGGHYNIGREVKNTATPNFFGGLYLNYNFLNRFNANINTYFMTDQEFRKGKGTGESSIYNTGDRFIANLKLSVDLNRQANLFISLRDLSNRSDAEYFYSDPINKMFLLGMNFELK